MNPALRVTLWATIGVATVAAGALAADEDSVKDEKSTGSSWGDETDARCDIRAFEVEKTAKSLVATVGLRGTQGERGVAYLSINTKGNSKSNPELTVDTTGRVYEVDGYNGPFPHAGEVRGQGKATTSGKEIVFKLPLAALGAPKTIGVQARSCGNEGTLDIAPGKDYYGEFHVEKIDYSYLTVDNAKRVIEGRVMLSCAGEKSCQRLPLKGVKVTAEGPKTYRIKTDKDGRFGLAVKKGVYKVNAAAGALHIKGKGERVELLKPGKKTANFEACGFDVPESASAARVKGGSWQGEYCSNSVTMSWHHDSKDLRLLNWYSVPTCGNDGSADSHKIFPKGKFDPSNIQITENKVTFKSTKYPIEKPPQGYLGADGKGLFTATSQEGDCRYSASVTLKHQN